MHRVRTDPCSAKRSQVHKIDEHQFLSKWGNPPSRPLATLGKDPSNHHWCIISGLSFLAFLSILGQNQPQCRLPSHRRPSSPSSYNYIQIYPDVPNTSPQPEKSKLVQAPAQPPQLSPRLAGDLSPKTPIDADSEVIQSFLDPVRTRHSEHEDEKAGDRHVGWFG